ncbi:hypothetical protein SAMN05216490_4413 [Mucilaginibacter mallensis]|uniref:Uncharacterized protein n=1 Tax=Mucilaginibacter mallensis TaxID=652787 RepID=A0A1H2BWV6_MUCMA|nr:hypothetical protein [Mucilaginibacter mallensis]SDT62547.1 hypothetical protein SAMN05216490_4413 [Mucilaginibacter mallensis]
MDRISFTIFIPDGKKFHWTPNWIMLILWTITIGSFWIFDSFSSSNDEFRTIVAYCVGGLSIYFIIASFFTYKALNGTLDGEIIFENSAIIVNDETFELKDINALDFSFFDYYGKTTGSGRDFNPKMYQGVNNYVTFTDKFNQTHTIYFKMETEHSYLSLDTFINAAIKAKKLQFKRGIDLLGIENISDK